MKDYYSILGVDRQATADEIKRAYRKQAAQHHPDKGGDTEQFQQVQEAYSILGDATARAKYDQPQPTFNFQAGADININDIFDVFNQRFNQNRQARRTQLRLTLWLTINDVFSGGRRPVSIGTPHGNIVAEIEIPPGIEDGETLQYSNIGPNGSDVIVTFRHHANPAFKIDGANVTTEIDVSVWACITGKQITVRGILGDSLMLTLPQRTQPGTMLRMRGQGLPIRHGIGTRGDLIVKIRAKLPDQISPELLEMIKAETTVDHPA